MNNNIFKIIAWILFWFYLIPYYLLKRFVFKKTTQPAFWANCATIGLLIILGLTSSPRSANISQQSHQDTALAKTTKIIHKTITKKIGTSELNKEKARSKVLKQEQKNKQNEYNKLKKQLDDYQEKEAEEKQKAEQERKQAEEQARKEAAAKKKEEERQASQEQDQNSSSSSQGDLYTANQGTIVGNRNSMIYHVPGQAGYHMNSANAVYFNSEQDAINAGYRKAKR